MPNRVTILLVEDNPDDAALTERALREIPARLEVARDAQEAVDYLFGEANDLPQLVVLDLKLPDSDGLEVLRRIREHQRTSLLPVVVLTSSTAPDDVVMSYRVGANSYVRKPGDFERFSEHVREIGSYWLGVNEAPSKTHDG